MAAPKLQELTYFLISVFWCRIIGLKWVAGEMKAVGNMVRLFPFKELRQGTGPSTAISLLSLLIGKNPENTKWCTQRPTYAFNIKVEWTIIDVRKKYFPHDSTSDPTVFSQNKNVRIATICLEATDLSYHPLILCHFENQKTSYHGKNLLLLWKSNSKRVKQKCIRNSVIF